MVSAEHGARIHLQFANPSELTAMGIFIFKFQISSNNQVKKSGGGIDLAEESLDVVVASVVAIHDRRARRLTARVPPRSDLYNDVETSGD